MTAWSVRDQSGSRLPLASRDRVRATAIGPVDPRAHARREAPSPSHPVSEAYKYSAGGWATRIASAQQADEKLWNLASGKQKDLCGLHPFPRYKIAARIGGNDRQGSI